jgi:glycosyltransferase involved in cell wall biosynthesis
MRLRALARGLGVSDAVVFLGARRDTSEIMRALDVLALPSTSEGFSNSLLEGLACALPCVATDVGGNRELLGDGALGRLVPPRDVRRLGDAMVELAGREGLRRELGEASRRHVLLNFGIPVAVDRWHRLLEGVAGRAAPGPSEEA